MVIKKGRLCSLLGGAGLWHWGLIVGDSTCIVASNLRNRTWFLDSWSLLFSQRISAKGESLRLLLLARQSERGCFVQKSKPNPPRAGIIRLGHGAIGWRGWDYVMPIPDGTTRRGQAAGQNPREGMTAWCVFRRLRGSLRASVFGSPRMRSGDVPVDLLPNVARAFSLLPSPDSHGMKSPGADMPTSGDVPV